MQEGEELTKGNPDAEEIAEVFEALRSQVPGLIKDIMDAVYSPERAENMAKSVATFYKTLVENGIEEKEALEMAKGLVVDFRRLFQSFGRRD